MTSSGKLKQVHSGGAKVRSRSQSSHQHSVSCDTWMLSACVTRQRRRWWWWWWKSVVAAESKPVADTPDAGTSRRGLCQWRCPVVNHDVTYPRHVSRHTCKHSRYITWPRGTRERRNAHLDPLAAVVTDQWTSTVSLHGNTPRFN